MSRDLHASMAAAVQEQSVRLAWIAEIEFVSGTLHLWTGVGALSWDAKTWNGVGNFGGVSPIAESTDLRASSLELTLSGIDSSLIGSVLGDTQQGRLVRLWLAAFDAERAIIGDPAGPWVGYFAVPTIEDGGETATITVQAESRWIALDRARTRHYTDVEQQQHYPGDRFFEFVASEQLHRESSFSGRPLFGSGALGDASGNLAPR